MISKILPGLKAFFKTEGVDRKALMGQLATGIKTAKGMCITWALLSVVLFGVFGAPLSGDRAEWFPVLVSLLKVGAFLISTVLCWRNAQNSDILSGRTVWQAIAAGMAFHALGDITLILWRSLWGITSAVSLGDVFYGASYVFLAIGFFQAVLPRQINLSWVQALGISLAGVMGVVLAFWLNFYSPGVEVATVSSQAISSQAVSSQSVASREADIIQLAGLVAPDVEAAGPDVPRTSSISVTAKGAAVGAVAPSVSKRQAPALVQLIDSRLSLITDKVGLLYVAGDCLLIVMAVALLIAFWGGTFSEAWKLIALAALCLYVADMFLVYNVGQGLYKAGSPWELFWILSALFFALGAEVEHGISAKMQQRRSRKQWL